MNAISVTMVKGVDTHFLQGYAFRAVVAIATLSWAGLQMLLVSGAYQKQEAGNHAAVALLGSLVLLLYSLFKFLRIRRLDATPARESTQLYFGAFLAVLPLLTWMMWKYLNKLLRYNHHLTHTDTSGQALLYSSVIISVAYFVTILVWLQTNVTSYDMAKTGSWSYRTMRWLQESVMDPYSK
jgi:hypothetical protein